MKANQSRTYSFLCSLKSGFFSYMSLIKERLKVREMCFKCKKLHQPARSHQLKPNRRQLASLKSVTGEYSALTSRPAQYRPFSAWCALFASRSQKYFTNTFPIRCSAVLSQTLSSSISPYLAVSKKTSSQKSSKWQIASLSLRFLSGTSQPRCDKFLTFG